MVRIRRNLLVNKTISTLVLICFLAFPVSAFSETRRSTTFKTPRFILHIDSSKEAVNMENFNVNKVANQSIKTLNKTYEQLSRIFKAKPRNKVVLRFLSPKEFKIQTGAPEWTSAMYFRDEITIPLTKKAMEQEELERALKHEYVHAFIAELSGYKCPAWLDEGVAQILEGSANPLLGPALRAWISNNNSIPLSSLENGFTTLDDSMVPAAYAESLFVTRSLIRKKGFASIIDYLKNLRAGMSNEKSFRVAFGISLPSFEKKLTASIRTWAISSRRDP